MHRQCEKPRLFDHAHRPCHERCYQCSEPRLAGLTADRDPSAPVAEPPLPGNDSGRDTSKRDQIGVRFLVVSLWAATGTESALADREIAMRIREIGRRDRNRQAGFEPVTSVAKRLGEHLPGLREIAAEIRKTSNRLA